MPADAAAEEQFGPYLVYERLGVGGMATVHRALERSADVDLERTVALKRLLPHLAEDASFIKAFVREAKLASYLSHGNIVQIYELGRVDTEYFISMEYIDGRDIRRILRHARKATGPPPLHVTVGLLLQLCEALDYAHHKTDEEGHPLGLVHRDVSPSNLLVTTQGYLKVIDFGIAKAQSSALRTQTGRVKGKLAYMAPEAIGGKELDARSDLFAAGVIAHELLTARPLFASKNEYQTLLKVQRGDILPPSTFNQACMPEMDAIVMKALAREPDDRYASAAAMRDDLNRLKRTAGLQTNARDIATWIEWAFSLEPAPGFSGATAEQTGSMQMTPPRSITPIGVPVRAATPRPEDDDAVEIAWGGGNEDNVDAGPVVLDDIPDVSGKHLAPRVPQPEVHGDLGAPNADGGGGDDRGDIPAMQPSHGVEPRRQTSRAIPLPRGLSSSGMMPVATREPRPDDTLPSGPPPTERMPSIADEPAIPEDVLRASEPLLDPAAHDLPWDPAKIVRTKPGHAPARRYAPAAVARAQSEIATPRRPTAAQGVVIGSSIIERQNIRRRWWLPLLAAVALVGSAGAAVYVLVLRDPGDVGDSATGTSGLSLPARAQEPGTVKFVMEPPDAEVRIADREAHAGSPWQTELAPGAYPVEIHRRGYKSWLTTLELSSRETQTMRVVLEPLGTQAAAQATATLAIATTPPGLEAVLDGIPIGQPTPIRMAIHPGAHVVLVRRAGVEVWRQDVTAQANATYEYAPVFTVEKERERQERPRLPTVRPEPDGPDGHDGPDGADVPIGPIGHGPVEPVAPAPTPVARDPIPVPPAPPPIAPPPAPVVVVTPPRLPAPPARVGPPPVVAPNAVTRLGGDAPSFTAIRGTEMPAIVSAKLCIDPAGHVTSADVMSKIDHRAAADIADALRTWTYAPYKQAGAATAACFVVAMRTK